MDASLQPLGFATIAFVQCPKVQVSLGGGPMSGISLAWARRLGEAPLSGTALTLERSLLLGISLLVFILLTSALKRWIQERGIRRMGYEPGKAQALLTIGHYLVVFMGTLALLRVGGVDLASLAVMAGAFSLGIGFGLQTIIHNFVSGLVILLERPIKVGDRIEVQGVQGRVARISFRSTVVVTNDNISVIVPNADLITATVINWTQTDRSVRFVVPVGVAYASDTRLVVDLLLQAARNHPGVLRNPAPDVLLDGFGESSLEFQLRVWTQDFTDRPGILKSEINLAIHDLFRERGVEIPFPQRVVHLHQSPAGPTPEA